MFSKQRNVIPALCQGPRILFHKNTGALYKLYPAKGYLLILTVDQRTDGWNRFQAKEREGAGYPPQHRPVAAMADTSGLPENFGSSVFYHHSARGRYQSSAELNANSST
jgi:hypothetical protein